MRNDGPGGSWSPIRAVVANVGAGGPATVVDPVWGEVHMLIPARPGGGSWELLYHYE